MYGVFPFLLLLSLAIFGAESSDSRVKLLVKQKNSISPVDFDFAKNTIKNVAVVRSGNFENSPIWIAADVRREIGIVSDPKNQSVASFSTDRLGLEILVAQKSSALNESISSMAIDWITGQFYIAVSTGNSARIEVCSLKEKWNCAVVLWKGLKKVVNLRLDPVEGYMYWMNPIRNRVERAWMDGQLLDTSPFEAAESSISALDLDVADKRLYFVQKSAGNDSSEIVQCYLYDRKSCRVVVDRIRPVNIGIFKEHLIWTENSETAGRIRYCKKRNCRSTMTSIEDSKNVESFVILEAESQPARLKPNPCLVNNGECSHYCLLQPGAPWRSCACPSGVKLSSDNAICASEDVGKVLFVASKSGLSFVSLDTDDLTPQAMDIPDYDPLTTTIRAVDYDAKSGNVYWSEEDGVESRIRRCVFKECSSVETILRFDKSTRMESLAIDHESRNLFWVDSGLRRISISKMDGSSTRVLLSHDLKKPRGLAVDSKNGHIYFSDWDDDSPKIERANLDGSERRFMQSNSARPKDIHVDAENGKIYWIDARTFSLKSANIRDGKNVETIAKGFHGPLTKLGDLVLAINRNNRLTATRFDSSGAESNIHLGSDVSAIRAVYLKIDRPNKALRVNGITEVALTYAF